MILTHEERDACKCAGNFDSICKAVEAAVIAKLSAGVEMPEPVGYLDPVGDAYTADQLQTAIAAARVLALEAAAKVCDRKWNGDSGIVDADAAYNELAKEIRALKGTP